MQLAVEKPVPHFPLQLLCMTVLAAASMPCHAAIDLTPDARLVADLEIRAVQANPREKPYLYTELADRLTMMASRQIQNGDLDQAAATLEKVETCSARIESEISDKSKGMKKAEMLMHATGRRLSDLLRVSPSDLKPHLQAALKRLNDAQNILLSKMFEH
jgi:hypothetical protein